MTETAGEMSPPRKKKGLLQHVYYLILPRSVKRFRSPWKKNNNKTEWRVVHEYTSRGTLVDTKHLMQVGTARFKDAHMHFTASRLLAFEIIKKKKPPRKKKKTTFE